MSLCKDRFGSPSANAKSIDSLRDTSKPPCPLCLCGKSGSFFGRVIDYLWFKRNDNEPLLALFCSTKAPASILLQVHDLAQQWRTGGVTVISGFHSPVEQECLAVLLRGPQPVIVCPARSLDRMRLKREYKEPMAVGRLLLLSSFGGKEKGTQWLEAQSKPE